MESFTFKLNLNRKQILGLAKKYVDKNKSSKEEKEIIETIVPRVKKRGYVTRKEFLEVCQWKTQRSKSLCKRNSPELIKEITQIAFTSKQEETRIKVLMLLNGVSLRTSSVFLHFFHRAKYPLLDVRALESLGVKVSNYNFDLWNDYTKFCRKISEKLKINMRTLDRALWQYSKDL